MSVKFTLCEELEQDIESLWEGYVYEMTDHPVADDLAVVHFVENGEWRSVNYTKKDVELNFNEGLWIKVDPQDPLEDKPYGMEEGLRLTVNRDHIRKVAEEQGIKVEFDSPTPGVRDPKTGEVTSFFDVMDDFLNPSELTLKGRIIEELREHLAEQGIFDISGSELTDAAGRMMKEIDEMAKRYAEEIKASLDNGHI